MPGIIAVLLIVVPLLELYVILQVADAIGILETILSLIAVSVLGTWLLTREGIATWKKLRATMARGEVPSRELTDGALIICGGALLLTPGFITDAVGLFLLFPPTRASVKGVFRRMFAWWFARRSVGSCRAVYDVGVTKVERKPSTPPTETAAPRLPSSQRPDGADESKSAIADDSPGRG